MESGWRIMGRHAQIIPVLTSTILQIASSAGRSKGVRVRDRSGEKHKLTYITDPCVRLFAI